MMYAVIMAGGKGTRFWPRSRESEPKQFLKIAGGRTLLQDTVARIAPIIPAGRTLVVTGSGLAGRVKEQVPAVPNSNVILEPVGRNTAPCVGLAAFLLVARDPDAVMAIMPSDHVIRHAAKFRSLLKAAGELAAKEDVLITLGLKPSRPETGYGYVEFGKALGKSQGLAFHSVRRFTEKPNLATAKRYLKTGRHFWNSGMFVWRASVVLEAIKRFLPETYKKLERIAAARNSAEMNRRLCRIFPTIEPVSIDYGVMEKAENIVGFPAGDLGWNDVGSWSSLAEVKPADKNHNVSEGALLAMDSKGLVVHAPGKLVAAVGVSNLVIVETDDAILICAKDRDQEIRKVIEALSKKGLKKYL